MYRCAAHEVDSSAGPTVVMGMRPAPYTNPMQTAHGFPKTVSLTFRMHARTQFLQIYGRKISLRALPNYSGLFQNYMYYDVYSLRAVGCCRRALVGRNVRFSEASIARTSRHNNPRIYSSSNFERITTRAKFSFSRLRRFSRMRRTSK